VNVSKGRVVFYTDPGGTEHAGDVVRVHEDKPGVIDLVYHIAGYDHHLTPNGRVLVAVPLYASRVGYDADGGAETWRWPPRVS